MADIDTEKMAWGEFLTNDERIDKVLVDVLSDDVERLQHDRLDSDDAIINAPYADHCPVLQYWKQRERVSSPKW